MYISSAVAGLLGLILSMVFLPDVNGMELTELDDLWVAIKVRAVFIAVALHR